MESHLLTLADAPARARDGRPRFDRFGYASGAAAAALHLAGAILFITQILPDLPPLHAPAPERAAFYAAMSRDSLYRGISYMAELQMPLLLLFSGALFGLLRRGEGEGGALSTAVLGAGFTLAVVSPIVILLEDHLMLGFAAAGVDPVIVASIDGIAPLSFALGGFPQAIVAFGTAAILMPSREIPRWLGWLGAAVGALSIVGSLTLLRGALFPLSALAMLLFRVWLLLLGIALLRAAGRSRPA